MQILKGTTGDKLIFLKMTGLITGTKSPYLKQVIRLIMTILGRVFLYPVIMQLLVPKTQIPRGSTGDKLIFLRMTGMITGMK